ncbi:MAG: type III-A CRISPR-associated RAMP protein Csm3 [Nitrospirae bacterium]|nr:type III-A CRISPR-associated RAMP protein Csm3 [Nitrospirota bacterium]
MKISKYINIIGTIHCVTGLRIGGTKEGIVEPGSIENIIIRDPLTSMPYIPGSSLKGKMRSLLELDKDSGAVISDSEPCGCCKCLVCKVFGTHAKPKDIKAKSLEREITRIIVRDCPITGTSKKDLEGLEEKGINGAEIKTENIIDRKTGMAADRGLRSQERVPAGINFDMEIVLKIFEGDDEAKITEFVKHGLGLVQKDYLGGSGSRGYGKVEIKYSINDETALSGTAKSV